MTAKPRPMSSVPNRDGFTLTLYLTDGTTTPATVIKGSDGVHRLDVKQPYGHWLGRLPR